MTGKALQDGAIINPDATRKPASPEGKPTVTVLDYGSGNVRSAVRALERAGAIDGRYHVLGGVLSPLDGIGPSDLTIDQLIE